MSDNQAITYLSGGDQLCLRCKVENAILMARKEVFCKSCFIRFVRGKQRKQMQDDVYKVKYGPLIEKLGVQKVLLALSGGPSSLVLLDVIGSLLQDQFEGHNGKQGFELVILNLDEFELNTLNKKIQDVLPALTARYPSIGIQYKVLSLNEYILDTEMIERIIIDKEFTGFTQKLHQKHKLTDLLAMCPTKSSVEDLLTIVYDELILRTAYVEKCQTIVYGHSMTRIANEIIALTVKGRGSIVYKAISDHTVNFRDQEFKILFPLRDVLYAEIIAYYKLVELDQYEVQSTIAKSKITKNLTIRDLTTNYFNMLDSTGYASTASTVVKTGEKLGKPNFNGVLANCRVCGVEIYQDPREWLRRITVNDSAPLETDAEIAYSELYKSSFPPILDTTQSTRIDICYGCIVTLGGVKQDTGFIWPLKNDDVTGLTNNYIVTNDTQQVLDEFILTDDEDE